MTVRRTLVACSSLSFLLLAQCDTLTESPPAVATVEITAPRTTVVVGETLQLTATARSASGAVVTGHQVTWSSLEDRIATVSSSGLVTGVAEGSVNITARVETVIGSFTVGTIASPTASLTSAAPSNDAAFSMPIPRQRTTHPPIGTPDAVDSHHDQFAPSPITSAVRRP